MIMQNDDLVKACRILDLSPENLNLKSLKEKYWKLLKIYRYESMAAIPLINDFAQEEINSFLSQLEEAYRFLLAYCQGSRQNDHQADSRQLTNPLKELRQLKGIDLKELSEKSGISQLQLQKLEAEQYDQLPPLVYLKLFLKKIAPILGVSSEKLITYYEKSHQLWIEKNKKSPAEKTT